MTNRFSFVDWVLVWAFWSACQSYKNHDCRGRIMIERYILPQKRGKENTNVPETRYSYFHLHFSTRKGKLGMGSKTSRESLSFGQTFLGPPPPPTSVCPCLSLLPQMFKFVVGLLFWQQKVKYLKSANLLCIWEIKQQKDRQQWTVFTFPFSPREATPSPSTKGHIQSSPPFPSAKMVLRTLCVWEVLSENRKTFPQSRTRKEIQNSLKRF